MPLVKPVWLKIRPPTTEMFSEMKTILREHNLNTVCQGAHCPNAAECWSSGTAAFMILGDTCTRGCRFCAVKKSSRPALPNPAEPENLAAAVSKLNLGYAVITSVDRDDLPDKGAGHFADCIRAVKASSPKTVIEVLIPDFSGDAELVNIVIEAGPDVIGHNIETVRRLQEKARDFRANYEQSLAVLAHIKRYSPRILTKSSIMAGFGESREETTETMRDLRKSGVDIITIGQYLSPGPNQLPVEEFVTPEKFEWYRQKADALGFTGVAAGPFVRSSYKAAELFTKSKLTS